MRKVKGYFEGPNIKTKFTVYDTALSRGIAVNIFSGITYPKVPFIEGVKVILDVGANIGAFAVYAASMYPEAKVYAFEPSKEVFELLKENTTSFQNINIFNYGFDKEARKALLYTGIHDSVESSLKKSARVKDSGEEVVMMKPEAFLDGLSEDIDILKLDVEGNEREVLFQMVRWVDRIKVIYLEYHSEIARILMDSFLVSSHALWRAKVENIHRGEFCYIRKDLVPENILTPELGEFKV